MTIGREWDRMAEIKYVISDEHRALDERLESLLKDFSRQLEEVEGVKGYQLNVNHESGSSGLTKKTN